MVNQFLCFCLCQDAFFQVTLNINIEECRNTSYTHGSTILCLNSSQITKVKPLNSFFCIFCRTWNVIAINLSHFFHSLQRFNLLCNFLTKTNYIVCHRSASTVCFIFLFLFDQKVNTIQSYTTVIADDTSTSVSIRKTGYDVAVTSLFHLRCIRIKNSSIVCFMVFIKNFIKLWIWCVTISCTCLFCHLNTTIWHKRTFQRLVCLKTNNFLQIFQFFFNISRAICSQRRYNLCLHI